MSVKCFINSRRSLAQVEARVDALAGAVDQLRAAVVAIADAVGEHAIQLEGRLAFLEALPPPPGAAAVH
jgi:hypothetical protein